MVQITDIHQNKIIIFKDKIAILLKNYIKYKHLIIRILKYSNASGFVAGPVYFCVQHINI